MKKTVEEIHQFNVLSSKRANENSKIGYAIKKVGKQINKIVSAYQEKIEDAKILFCSVDEKENVIKDEKGNYVFTRENLAALTKKIRELYQEEYKIEPFVCTETPKDLSEEEIEVFTGFII